MIYFGRRPKRNIGKIFTRLLLILAVITAGVWFWYVRTLTKPISQDPRPVSFVVPAGWGSTEISEALEQASLIRSDVVFKLYTWKRGTSSSLQSGEYFLSPNMNIIEIADALRRGPGTTKERSITIIEGWKLSNIAEYLQREGLATEDEFYDVVQYKQDWWDEYPLLESRPRNVDLEGYLYPDTYRIFTDSDVEIIVRKMLNNLEQKVTPEMREEIAKQGKTFHEIITLASILEREVRSDEDRRKVADLFYRRLDAGMALQADSTVNYATGKDLPAVTSADLEIDSPYNTYKYRGLPPGPIASPSISSISAAIYPQANDAWFFLTTLDDGRVIYSVTHDEHVDNKFKYLK